MYRGKFLMLPVGMLAIISLVVGPLNINVNASTETDETLTMTGNGKTASLALKATEDNGDTERVDNFQLTAANVLQIERNDDVRITNDVDFDKARTVDINDNEKEIGIDSDGNVDFDSYAQGTYRLQVITDNGERKLYEGIVVIGPENKDEVSRIIQKTIVEITVDIDCGKGFVERNGDCVRKPKPPSVCYFNPMHKDCDPVDGHCPKGFGMNDDDRCIPTGECPDGYGRAEDDETGTCYKDENLRECEDGSIRLPQYCNDDEEPIIDECEEGYVLSDEGICESIPPTGDCTGVYNPETGQCEDVSVEEPIAPEEPITEPEEPEPEPIDDPPVEDETTDEGESEEQEEEITEDSDVEDEGTSE